MTSTLGFADAVSVISLGESAGMVHFIAAFVSVSGSGSEMTYTRKKSGS